MTMAKWDKRANQNFIDIKSAAHASDAQMQTLKEQIGTWADGDPSPDDNTSFPFGQYRHSRVEVKKVGGWITQLDYGEN
jgi:hypothetical protein